VNGIGLTEDRKRWRALVDMIMDLHIPKNAGKLSNHYTACGLLISAELHGIS
jgi:hypothetical protein